MPRWLYTSDRNMCVIAQGMEEINPCYFEKDYVS